ncbi:MAG: YbhB/YbcL family Raf kinase inhibitor-like protein [Actinobacteria bacterium]|nr:MAG: YbhB/YbcL family Raf kinase inhibitor-like protein [Actinomycetota bacterium]
MFTLISSAYKNNERMPEKYANMGVVGAENKNPPLKWEGAPVDTQSFAVVMVDHHPVANEFVHWLVINIPKDADSLPEGASPHQMPGGAKELNTTYQKPGYGGPRPPVGSGDHPYETIIYALNIDDLSLDSNAGIAEFQDAIKGKILGQAGLTGLFSQ